MDATAHKSFTDLIINGLKKSVAELEEFNVQVSLGKMEARDAFETAKKKMNNFLHESEVFLQGDNEIKDLVTEFRTALDELRVQLALGKADTRDAFEEQRKKITAVFHKLETFFESRLAQTEAVATLQIEMAKFRIRLEILKLRFELNRMDAHEEFEAGKKAFAQRLEKIRESAGEIEKHGHAKWSHFKDEIAEAYGDLRKAFVG